MVPQTVIHHIQPAAGVQPPPLQRHGPEHFWQHGFDDFVEFLERCLTHAPLLTKQAIGQIHKLVYHKGAWRISVRGCPRNTNVYLGVNRLSQ